MQLNKDMVPMQLYEEEYTDRAGLRCFRAVMLGDNGKLYSMVVVRGPRGWDNLQERARIEVKRAADTGQ